MPSFAFINGAALGGGLELALHCTYRTISSGVGAVAFPECFLGLVPGWGGTYLLPRLIGPARALKVIIENPLSQNRCSPARRRSRSASPTRCSSPPTSWPSRCAGLCGHWLVAVPRAGPTHWVLKHGPPAPRKSGTQAVAGARFLADGKLHGAAPAPYRAIDLVAAARTASRDEAFAAEDEALADLLLCDELRAGLYAFDLTQKRARKRRGRA